MVFQLEILKARHFGALRLRRATPAEEEREEAVERVLEAGEGVADEPSVPVRQP
jgi:hypothetical protein